MLVEMIPGTCTKSLTISPVKSTGTSSSADTCMNSGSCFTTRSADQFGARLETFSYYGFEKPGHKSLLPPCIDNLVN